MAKAALRWASAVGVVKCFTFTLVANYLLHHKVHRYKEKGGSSRGKVDSGDFDLHVLSCARHEVFAPHAIFDLPVSEASE